MNSAAIKVETIRGLDFSMAEMVNGTKRVKATSRIQQNRNVYMRTVTRLGAVVWESYRTDSSGIEMFTGYVTDEIRHAGLESLSK